MEQKDSRKEPRLSLVGSNVNGLLRLTPGSEGIPVTLNDVSASGASITLLGQIGGDTRQMLLDLSRSYRLGRLAPVQLLVNEVRIPVNIVNAYVSGRFGLCISSNEKMAVLAERGRAVFGEFFQRAAGNGAQEAQREPVLKLGREFLPPDVRDFVEGEYFETLLISALADELSAAVPSLKGKVEEVGEFMKIAVLCQKFLKSAGRDMPFVVGAEMCGILEREGGGFEDVLEEAVRKICGEGRLFSDDEQKASFEKTLAREYFKNRLPSKFADLPASHKHANLISTRFANFGHEQNFFPTLAPFLASYYFDVFLPRDSEMVRTLGGNETRLKNTVYRWVHGALNQFAADVDRAPAMEIEGRFKQAMYEFFRTKNSVTITPADIMHLIDGKGLEGPLAAIRGEFLQYASGMIDPAVQKRFQKHQDDQEKEVFVPVNPAREEARKIAAIAPLDLLLRHLWGKVVEFGLANAHNKEVARTFVPKEKSACILETEGMIVFNQTGYHELRGLLSSRLDEEHIAACFDKIEFNRQYELAANPEVKRKDAPMGFYINSLQPPALREAVVEKVVRSPEWGVCYSLKKPKSFFEKAMGDAGTEMIALIEKQMLTSTPETPDP